MISTYKLCNDAKSAQIQVLSNYNTVSKLCKVTFGRKIICNNK